MHEAIQIGIIGHIEPCCMKSMLQKILYGVGEKSVFVQGAREVDIEQMVCEAIMFLTLEVMRFPLRRTGKLAIRFTKSKCNVNVIYNVC